VIGPQPLAGRARFLGSQERQDRPGINDRDVASAHRCDSGSVPGFEVRDRISREILQAAIEEEGKESSKPDGTFPDPPS
jgi:hypothetical protein